MPNARQMLLYLLSEIGLKLLYGSIEEGWSPPTSWPSEIFKGYPLRPWFWRFRSGHISAIKASVKANRKLAKRLGPESLNVVLVALGAARMASVCLSRNRDFGTFQKMVCSIFLVKSRHLQAKMTNFEMCNFGFKTQSNDAFSALIVFSAKSYPRQWLFIGFWENKFFFTDPENSYP